MIIKEILLKEVKIILMGKQTPNTDIKLSIVDE